MSSGDTAKRTATVGRRLGARKGRAKARPSSGKMSNRARVKPKLVPRKPGLVSVRKKKKRRE